MNGFTFSKVVDPPLAVVLVGSQRGALMSALIIVASLDHLDFYEDGLPPLGWIVPLKTVMAVSQKGALTSALLFADH